MKEYISEQNRLKMDHLLMDNNVDLIIKTMIKEYTQKSIYNAQNLITYMNDIISNILNIVNNDVNQLTLAGQMLILQKEMNKSDVHTYFATLVPVMKTLYPDGLDDNASLAQKNYFNEFIDLYKNKKVFSWDNKNDVDWANHYKYTDYLKMIFDKYIDKKDNSND